MIENNQEPNHPALNKIQQQTTTSQKNSPLNSPASIHSPTTKHRSISSIKQESKSQLARSSTQELIQENALIFVKPEDVEVELGEPFQLQAVLRHDLNSEDLYEVKWFCEGVVVEEEEDIFIDCTRNNCRLLFNACLEADRGIYDVSCPPLFIYKKMFSCLVFIKIILHNLIISVSRSRSAIWKNRASTLSC